MDDIAETLQCAGDYKRMADMDRLVLIRTLRPDRLTAAMAAFVGNTLGAAYIISQPFSLDRSFQVSSYSRIAMHNAFLVASSAIARRMPAPQHRY